MVGVKVIRRSFGFVLSYTIHSCSLNPSLHRITDLINIVKQEIVFIERNNRVLSYFYKIKTKIFFLNIVRFNLPKNNNNNKE